MCSVATVSPCKPSRALKRRIAIHHSYTSSLDGAKPRSLLKLDQAYIAVGGREHLTLERETDIMRVIALRISPRDAEVPSSTLSADEMQGAEFSTRSASSISRWD